MNRGETATCLVKMTITAARRFEAAANLSKDEVA